MLSPSSDPRLQAINHDLKRKWQWFPLTTQGTSNKLYRNNSIDEPRLLRLNATEQIAFGVCRDREAIALESISAFSWSPKIFANNPQSGWCLMYDYGEQKPTERALLTTVQLPDIITQMQLHPTSPNLRVNINSLWTLYENHINDIPTKTRKEGLLLKLQSLRQIYASLPEIPCCLSHQDLHPGNLITSGNQLIVLDWEYAAVTPPWLDAAALYTEFAITARTIRQLPAFNRLSENVFEKALENANRYRSLLSELWFDCRSSN